MGINVYENKCAVDFCVDLKRYITSNHSFKVCAQIYKKRSPFSLKEKVSLEATDEVLVGVVRPSSPCSAGTFSRPGEGNFLFTTRYSLLATRNSLFTTRYSLFAIRYSQLAQLHPVVLPHVSHFKHVPFRTRVKLAHSGQLSPT